ncbi:hypothetical protein LOC68_17000 [Blastopirellula sp. JC732]|uniref:Uncharacterized protein n=1 Tax=Blastopirellula sediminis TaxID=2894196 RepID=A0A9X1MMW2_9BACT|nr:hypothetical protein [Blastopirellula sediminis]MCC9606610.1 hypothetical protein [Blastopirellula sediminis]MCC9630093.1 hypothetical protein [Blastopirellula sediminis]
MDEIAYDAATAPAAEKRGDVPWRALAFTGAYGAAILAVVVTLSHWPDVYSWLICIPAMGAGLAMSVYLLTMSPRRFAGIAILLLGLTAAIVGMCYLDLSSRDLALAKIQFSYLRFYGASVGCVAAALAYWSRRRYWRIQPVDGEGPESPKRISIPMSVWDYVYLATCVGALILFHRTTESVPISVIVVGLLHLFVRVGLAPATRGFSPPALIVTGLVCLAALFQAVWLFYPVQSPILIALVGIPSLLWGGILLSLRGDGYRRVQDFSAYAENVPIAEPDPLA